MRKKPCPWWCLPIELYLAGLLLNSLWQDTPPGFTCVLRTSSSCTPPWQDTPTGFTFALCTSSLCRPPWQDTPPGFTCVLCTSSSCCNAAYKALTPACREIKTLCRSRTPTPTLLQGGHPRSARRRLRSEHPLLV